MRRLGFVLVMMAVALVVGSGVALAAVKFGTDGRDVLIGTNSEDKLFGKGGSDFLAGKKQDDVLSGDDGNDIMHGGAVGWGMAPDGEDKLFGGDGSDCMFGGSLDDVLIGGPGNDDMGHYCYEFIFDTGEDTFYGGSGDDFVWSWDYSGDGKAQRDLVVCGTGRDEVLADKLDQLYNCEKVERLGLR
jgi:Ca2+-binding RTX toxin-like protein